MKESGPLLPCLALPRLASPLSRPLSLCVRTSSLRHPMSTILKVEARLEYRIVALNVGVQPLMVEHAADSIEAVALPRHCLRVVAPAKPVQNR